MKLEKQIAKLVQDHYKALDKKYDWTFGKVPVVGYRFFEDSISKEDTIEFCIHAGGVSETTYRWVDDADVLFPKLKKLTKARAITVGCLGDNSQAGGIVVTLKGVRV